MHNITPHNVLPKLSVKVRMCVFIPNTCAHPGTSRDSLQSANHVYSLVACSFVHQAAARLPKALYAQDRIAYTGKASMDNLNS